MNNEPDNRIVKQKEKTEKTIILAFVILFIFALVIMVTILSFLYKAVTGH